MPMSKGKQMNSMPPMEVVTTGNRMSKGGMGKKSGMRKGRKKMMRKGRMGMKKSY